MSGHRVIGDYSFLFGELFNIDFNGNFICAAPDCNGMTESLGIFKEKQKEMFSPF